MKEEINGILILNKPTGISSNSASNKVKYLLNAKKAGHLGTLDPIGTGVLPVTLGKATKLFDYYLKKTKTYTTMFEFGYETTTLDIEGEKTNSNDIVVCQNDIEKVLPKFIGEFDQMPPNFSAKKVNGKRAYELARKGEEVILKPKRIFISEIRVLSNPKSNVFELEVCCGSGTYIRSLCRDIAHELSTYGTMLSITRTTCGGFNIKNSCTFEDIKNGNYSIIPMEKLPNPKGEQYE